MSHDDFARLHPLDNAAIVAARKILERQPRADYTIFELPSGGPVLATDIVPIWRNGQTYQVTVAGFPVAVSLFPNTITGPYNTGGGAQLGYRTDDIYNVRDSGALGDGTTDDTAAIQRAITACGATGGGVVYMPTGLYVVSSPLTIPNHIALLGAGYPQTQIKAMGSTTTAGVFVGASVTGTRFENFGVTFPTAATGGSVFSFTSSYYLWIKNVLIGNGWNDITLNACLVVYIEQLVVSKTYLPGAANTCDSVYITGNTTEVHMRDCVISTTAAGNANACRAGIHMDSSQQILMTNCDIQQFQYGLWVNPGAGQSTFNNCVLECQFDFCSLYGILMQSLTATSSIYLCTFERSWASGAGQSGLMLNAAANGAKLDAIIINTHQAINNKVNGLTLSGALTNVLVSNSIFGSNGVTSVGAGIGVLGGTRISLCNNVCGNIASYPATQDFGISWDGNTVSLQMSDNDCSNNLNNGGNNGGTAASYRIRNNNGYNPVGSVASPAMTSGVALTNPFGIDATVYISGGTVSNIYIGGNVTTLMGGSFRVPAGQTITVAYTAAPTTAWVLD